MQKLSTNLNLTPRQLQLLEAIKQFQETNCFSPTIGELAERLQISRSTAFEHIAELRKKGLLSAEKGRARSFQLSSPACRLLDERDIAKQSAEDDGICLLGRVAAGSPIEAVVDKQTISLDDCFGGSGVFALEVEGDSMIEEDIRDGDIVICRKASVADDGRLVIAIVDDENATLKRFYKEENAVRLQPANPDYQPIYSTQCRIEAVVIGLVRKF